MKIIVTHKPMENDDYEENNRYAYSMNAEFECDGNAFAYEALSMWYKAMIVDGYLPESIRDAMRQFVVEDEQER